MTGCKQQGVERVLTGRPARHGVARGARAFTLLELLVVIAVAGLLATLSVPAIKNFGKSNAQVAATRQMLDTVGRARQLAIANRTTVYLVFLPQGYLTQPGYSALNAADQNKALQLAPGQGRAYALVSLRSVGDQPGRSRPKYHIDWTTLPQGWIIDPAKFLGPLVTTDYDVPGNRVTKSTDPRPRNIVRVSGFQWSGLGTATNALPFPSATSTPGLFALPYLEFRYDGGLTSARDSGGELIPLARGVVDAAEDQNGRFLVEAASVQELPQGNAQEVPNLIFVDALTGRARLEERKIQ